MKICFLGKVGSSGAMQMDIMSRQYTNFDVNMAWDVRTINGKTVIDGVIRNIRYATMEGIEIRVVLLDSNGKTVSRAVDLVTPGRLEMNMSAGFRVVMPIVAPHGAKLVFTYSYEGYDGGDGTKWMQSFDSCVP